MRVAFALQVVVADGVKVREEGKKAESWKRHRNGVVVPAEMPLYQEYIENLRARANDAGSSLFGAQVLALSTRHGFGFAVREALPHVRTPFVMVVQHDRAFTMRTSFDLRGVLSLMADQPDRVKYMLAPTSSTKNYASRIQTTLGAPRSRSLQLQQDAPALKPFGRVQCPVHTHAHVVACTCACSGASEEPGGTGVDAGRIAFESGPACRCIDHECAGGLVDDASAKESRNGDAPESSDADRCVVHSFSYTPLYRWYDSTHVAQTQWLVHAGWAGLGSAWVDALVL